MRRLAPHLAPLGYSPRRYAPLSPAPVLGMGERLTDLRDIQQMFANGELGGYWPADPAYAYEDSAGTTLASVDGVVGLRLNSKPDSNIELYSNTVFSAWSGDNPTGWNVSAETVTEYITQSVSGANLITGGNQIYFYQQIADSLIKKIEIDVTVISGSIKLCGSTGGDIGVLDIISNSGRYVFYSSRGVLGIGIKRSTAGLATNVIIHRMSVQTTSDHAIQATTANKPYRRTTPSTGKTWYDSNTATGALTATFSGSLGSSCTIATVTPEGVSILENQTVGSTYNIAPPYGYSSDVLIINRALTAAEKTLVTRVMQRDMPAYGSLVNAIPQMRGLSTNNEMQIDWSTKTSFVNYWRYGGNYLSSFPLIDTSKGTNFSYAWSSCSSLSSFPAAFFDAWVGVPIADCFLSTWYNCTSLTETSVSNIVVSLAASSQSAPATGKEITLWGAPALATIQANSTIMAAVTTLKSRGWISKYKGTAL